MKLNRSLTLLLAFFIYCPSWATTLPDDLPLTVTFLNRSFPLDTKKISFSDEKNAPFMDLPQQIPTSLKYLKGLVYLDASYQPLTGPIPESFAKLTALMHLDLSVNCLNCSLPDHLKHLRALTHLNIGSAGLTGPIPQLKSLKSLTYLDLSLNELTGPFPSWVTDLPSLKHLDLHENDLEGELPSDWKKDSALIYLNLKDNEFKGSLPASLGKMVNLKKLILSDNELSGSLPGSLANLVQLEEIALDNNQFTGEIPAFLAELPSLKEINLEYNQFSMMPASLFKWLDHQRQLIWEAAPQQKNFSISEHLSLLHNPIALIRDLPQPQGYPKTWPPLMEDNLVGEVNLSLEARAFSSEEKLVQLFALKEINLYFLRVENTLFEGMQENESLWITAQGDIFWFKEKKYFFNLKPYHQCISGHLSKAANTTLTP